MKVLLLMLTTPICVLTLTGSTRTPRASDMIGNALAAPSMSMTNAHPTEKTIAPTPSFPAPSVPAPVPVPSVPAPVPVPSVPAPSAPTPGIPAPSVPAPSVPVPPKTALTFFEKLAPLTARFEASFPERRIATVKAAEPCRLDRPSLSVAICDPMSYSRA